MQYVNDDMDELFRRAAENYPLNTNTADWNEVQKKLIAAGVAEQETVVEKKKFNKSLLLLLLLLPAIWIYVNSVQQQKQPAGKMTVGESVIQNPSTNNNVSSANNSFLSNSVSATNKTPAGSLVSGPLTIINEKRNSQPQKTLSLRDRGGLKATVGQPEVSIVEGNDESQSPSQPSEENKTYETLAQIPADENKIDLPLRNQLITAPVLKADMSDIGNQPAIKNRCNKKEKKKERTSLYAGFIFSPDVSTVKMQTVKNVGTGFGLKLGYQFNKRISLESGILFDKKIYYSSGEYVSTKRISVPNYSSVKDVNGVCRMIEVPLDIKYNISKPGKTVFSVAAGVASYFMQKEIYDYTYDYTSWQGHGRSIYKKSSSDLLAVMSFSVGYARKVNKNTTLIVAPYLKIPFKGVGIGSLPITSTGVNIGITRNLVTF